MKDDKELVQDFQVKYFDAFGIMPGVKSVLEYLKAVTLRRSLREDHVRQIMRSLNNV